MVSPSRSKLLVLSAFLTLMGGCIIRSRTAIILGLETVARVFTSTTLDDTGDENKHCRLLSGICGVQIYVIILKMLLILIFRSHLSAMSEITLISIARIPLNNDNIKSTGT